MADTPDTEEKPVLEPVALEEKLDTEAVEAPVEDPKEAEADASVEGEGASASSAEFTEVTAPGSAGFVKPWFLKTEDIYEVVRNAAADVKVGDVVLAERAVTVVDGFAVAIAKKVLRVSETEGFSIMRRMDELMIKILQGVDVSVDVLSVKFAEAVAQLQVAVLYHAEWTSELVKEQAMQAKAAGEAMLLKMQETEQYKKLREQMDPAITGAVAVYGTADTSVRALVNKLEQDYPEAAARIKSLLVLPHPDQLSAANIIAGVNKNVVGPMVAGSSVVYGAVAPKVQAASSAVYDTTVNKVLPAAAAGTSAVVTATSAAYTTTVDAVQNRVIPATIAGAIAASTACINGSTKAYETTRDTMTNTIIPATVAGATNTYNTLQPACVSGATALYNRGTPIASALYQAALPAVAQMMERAQPFVHKAVEASAPYVSKVSEAASPVVSVATDISMPVFDKIAEAGRPFVQPALDNPYVSGAIAGTLSAAEALRRYGTPVKAPEGAAPAPPAYTEEETAAAVAASAPVEEAAAPAPAAPAPAAPAPAAPAPVEKAAASAPVEEAPAPAPAAPAPVEEAPIVPPTPPVVEKEASEPEPDSEAPAAAPEAEAGSSADSTPTKEMAAASISSPASEKKEKKDKKEKGEKKDKKGKKDKKDKK
jgi:hypothetical protein